MKIFLMVLAGLFFLGPLLVWGLMSGMNCAYVTTVSDCSVRWGSFLDPELLSFSALPWGIGLICFLVALRTGR